MSGQLGNGLFGMQNFKKRNRENMISSAYLKPKALIDYGKTIAQFASSAIDISDGFLQDLGHLSKASNVGFELSSSSIPYNSNLSLNKCLNCGDDYQLIFTVPKKNIQSLAVKMKKMRLKKCLILNYQNLFFRFFDIVKPWPISWVDKNIKNGPGILIDDLLAGLFTSILMLAISKIII